MRLKRLLYALRRMALSWCTLYRVERNADGSVDVVWSFGFSFVVRIKDDDDTQQ